MRNIEKLRNYFLGKDPQLKETMADNSLRLIGIEGKNFVLRTELLKRLQELCKHVDDADITLQNHIDDEALARQNADNDILNKMSIKMLEGDISFAGLNPDIETGLYYTGPYKVTTTTADYYPPATYAVIAAPNTLFYYDSMYSKFDILATDMSLAYPIELRRIWHTNPDDQIWEYEDTWLGGDIEENKNRTTAAPSMKDVYDFVTTKVPFTALTEDLRIYEDQPLDPSWESGWYYTGPYKIYFQDFVEPAAFENTIFYYHKAVGETYITFIPETLFDNYELFKLFLWWDEDDQQWYSDALLTTTFINNDSTDSQIPTAGAVYNYVQNSVVRHLSSIAAASSLTQGLYVADDDVRIIGPHEQLQLSTGDFIIVQPGTGSIDIFMIVIAKDCIKVATYSSDHIVSKDYAYVQNAQPKSERVTTVSSSSTDTTYPTAKAVYDATLHTYSTTEQVVGTWTDGKPLYEKTITQLVQATDYVEVTIADVGEMFFQNSCATYDDGSVVVTYGLPYRYNNNVWVFADIVTDKSTHVATVTLQNDRSVDITFNVTVRYTKTTD